MFTSICILERPVTKVQCIRFLMTNIRNEYWYSNVIGNLFNIVKINMLWQWSIIVILREIYVFKYTFQSHKIQKFLFLDIMFVPFDAIFTEYIYWQLTFLNLMTVQNANLYNIFLIMNKVTEIRSSKGIFTYLFFMKKKVIEISDKRSVHITWYTKGRK